MFHSRRGGNLLRWFAESAARSHKAKPRKPREDWIALRNVQLHFPHRNAKTRWYRRPRAITFSSTANVLIPLVPGRVSLQKCYGQPHQLRILRKIICSSREFHLVLREVMSFEHNAIVHGAEREVAAWIAKSNSVGKYPFEYLWFHKSIKG